MESGIGSLGTRRPTLTEMVKAYSVVKSVGLKRIKLGNCSVFIETLRDWENLLDLVGPEAIG